MDPSGNALALARHFEGFRLQPYKDPVGLVTIGYGHRITTVNDPLCAGLKNRGQGEALLLVDMDVAGSHVSDLVHAHLEQWQFDALCDFTFNLGRGRLQTSTLLTRLNDGLYAAVPDELKRWVYGAGEVLPGLRTRRAAEASVWAGMTADAAIEAAEEEERTLRARPDGLVLRKEERT